MLKTILRLQPKMQSSQCRQRLYDVAWSRLTSCHNAKEKRSWKGYKEELQMLPVSTGCEKQSMPLDVHTVPQLPPTTYSSVQKGGIGVSDWLYSEQWQAGSFDLIVEDSEMFIVRKAFR